MVVSVVRVAVEVLPPVARTRHAGANFGGSSNNSIRELPLMLSASADNCSPLNYESRAENITKRVPGTASKWLAALPLNDAHAFKSTANANSHEAENSVEFVGSMAFLDATSPLGTVPTSARTNCTRARIALSRR